MADPFATPLFVQSAGDGATDLLLPLGDYSGNDGSYRVRSVAGTGAHRFNIAAPNDLGTLLALTLCGFPTAGASGAGKDIDLTSEYGNLDAGEVKNFHSETDFATTYVIPAVDTLFELDLTTVFSVLSAGDVGGVLVDHNAIGGAILYTHWRITYNPA